MRFVVLTDPDDPVRWSGSPNSLVQALRDGGHDVVTIAPPSEPLWHRAKRRFYRKVLGRTYIVDRAPGVLRARARNASRVLAELSEIDAVLATHPPDAAYLKSRAPVMVVHDATWLQLVGYYPGWERNRLAGETLRAGIRLDRRAVQNSDRVIYCSSWARASAVRDYGIEPFKIRVVPLGAGLAAEPSRSEIERWLAARTQGPCRLLFVGTDWHRKGGDTAIAVAQRLHDDGVDVELHVVGCDPPAPWPTFLRSHGYLSKRDARQSAQLWRLFEEASFFILPSRAECFGVVFCEAAAHGLPTIATNTGGIPEILGRGDWGTMLPPHAPPEAFARWIHAARADTQAYARMAWAARRDFEERLNWPVFCRELVKIVDSIERERR